MSTKQCPKCGNKNLILLRTLNLKVCMEHKKAVRISWGLNENQKPLL